MKKILVMIVFACGLMACSHQSEQPTSTVDSLTVDSLEVVDSILVVDSIN